MGVLIGLVVTFGSILGGYMAMGGKLYVLMQPFELVIIGGAGIGALIVANPAKVLKDVGRSLLEALKGDVPKQKDHLELLDLLYRLTTDLRAKSKAEMEREIDEPAEGTLFTASPGVLKDETLTGFVTDYARLILVGSARAHEIEALMDEEIETLRHDRLKAYGALQSMADAFPAIGIVAAVLGVIKAMGAISESPEVLGALIGAALVGTFLGVFLSYSIVGPLAALVKVVREKQLRPYTIVKQTLVAHLNGSVPQVAIEHGRKTIPADYRPTLAAVEERTLAGPEGAAA